ncbi:MAG: bifunctional fucokinase/L-fucose-1-P-guanylyltransferase [Muribaculaceae bacterium]|nr:bifunctional fucokinase/L-fucose-1-P-guanylyltransferase [Muribaculaceae bacterium]
MSTKKLLSLPPNLVDKFHDITGHDRSGWFATSDPVGARLGSGGGTTWLLEQCRLAEGEGSMDEWLHKHRRILLHAGGQSRRLPAYAPSGKVLTPIPVFRWKRGQSLNQTLLDVQLPLYERIMTIAPKGLNTMIVSGDVYVHTSEPLRTLPDADVICYGLWVDPSIAKNHGVFVLNSDGSDTLCCMAQKPSVETQSQLMRNHLLLMDIGIWLLSDKAVKLLVDRSKGDDGNLKFYDLYSEFGLALGSNPTIKDSELNELKVAIVPLDGGRFFHFGTSPEIISSMLAIQNLVSDQRAILHKHVKPHPAMFTQNAQIDVPLTAENSNIWIENSCIGKRWTLGHNTLITGVPANDWELRVPADVCIDVVPVGEGSYAARPYGFDDKFKGAIGDDSTLYIGRSLKAWCDERGVDIASIAAADVDIQNAPIFPLTESTDQLGILLRWMTSEPQLVEGKQLWLSAERLSADQLSEKANLRRLVDQRRAFLDCNYKDIAANYRKSVFYQTDLKATAADFVSRGIAMPKPIDESEPTMMRAADAMFRSEVASATSAADASAYADKATALMREGLVGSYSPKQTPRLSVYSDQIVWSRCPVRIDLAGGWTDTPPYSILRGGNVVNIAIELNGQPPLQAYVKPSANKMITLRSIDLGAAETVETWEQLADYRKVGSPFSIPKAALSLAGFHPNFCSTKYGSLRQQLDDFGCGIEITLLSAIPAGSGLGTSSILASTVLAAINDFCGLGWDSFAIGSLTLQLEQLLTTGGGWQDQYGGILPGVKLLQTTSGWTQQPVVRWLPENIFTNQDASRCHLLYYTGITRTAKDILSEIIKGMFLNEKERLEILEAMKQHALDMRDAIQLGRFEDYGRLVRRTWSQNCALDAGTNPDSVQAITTQIDDLCLGYKLPGAGGGGYLYMVAKDPEAAAIIRQRLTTNAPNARARFVELSLSSRGLETSRS